MFSYFGNRTSGMAFTTHKGDFARRAAVDHLATVLQAYMDGREKLYAVHDALREIRVLFADSAALPLDLIRQALALDPDDTRRLRLVTEAVQLIDRQTRGDFD